MACLLPVRPCATRGPSGLRLPGSLGNRFHSRVHPLRHLDATVASPPQTRRYLRPVRVDWLEPSYITPRLSSLPFSISGCNAPILSPLSRRLRKFACSPRCPALRVWLPSRRRSLHHTLGSLFQLPTLLGFPLQSFPPIMQMPKSFPSDPPPLHLRQKPPRLLSRAPTACPT